MDDREPDPRFTFANERTFLAWNRTALALVAGASALSQFLDDVSREGRLAIVVPLLVVAALIAVTSHGRWKRHQQALRRGDRLLGSILPMILAVGVSLVATTTAGVLLLSPGG